MGGGRFRGLASRLSYLRKQSKSGLRSNEGKWKAYSCSVGIFALSFVITLLIASLLTPTTITSAEENSSSSAQADGYSLSLSATSAVNLGLSVSDSDSMTVGLGNVSVTTTSPGYKLYISMTGDTTGLSGIADGISGNIPATSGTITSPTSLTRGTWGYAIPSSGVAHLVTSGFNTSYVEMSSTTPDSSKKFATPPVSSAPQLIAESSTATSSDNYPIYYGVMANSSTAPGDYSNTVMFTAVADAAVSDTLTLTPSSVNANTATAVTAKTSLYSTASDASAKIYFLTSAQYSQISGTNVEALGISPLTCTRTSGTPVTYNCNLPAQAKSGEYYFYVKFPTYDKVYASTFTILPVDFFSMSTMQQMAEHPGYCSNATTPATTATTADTTGARAGNTAYVPQVTLTDTRNNEAYTVRKLADGNCWMTENLRLELTANQVLSPEDTDVTVSTTVGASTQPYNQPSDNRYDWGVASTSDFNRSTVDRWLSRSTKKNGVWATETTPTQSGVPTTNLTGEDQKLGVYYNWYTATAGTGNYDITTGGITAQSSVCPAGWQLPRYSAVNGTSTLAPSGSWESLIRDTYRIITTQGDQGTGSTANAKLHAFPLSLPYSGNVDWESGGTESQGEYGAFWSAGSTSQTNARYLLFYGTYVWPEGRDNRLDGVPVRCIAKSFWNIDTMQSMTPAIASSVSTPSTSATSAVTTSADYEALSDKTSKVPQRTLYDTRDSYIGGSNQRVGYTVRKLADGNVWMTENLQLNWDSSRTFTPSDTNVTSNVTVTDATQALSSTGGDATTAEADTWAETDGADSGANRWLSRSTNGATENSYSAAQVQTGENQPLGTYYNWYTAVLGTVTGTGGATQDICPNGWQLPRYGSWTNLIVNAYGLAVGSNVPTTVTRLHSFPFSLPYSGYVYSYNGITTGRGDRGLFWNASAVSNTLSIVLDFFGTTTAYASNGAHKTSGHPVRCLAK